MTPVFLEVGGTAKAVGALFAWVVLAFCLVSAAYTVEITFPKRGSRRSCCVVGPETRFAAE